MDAVTHVPAPINETVLDHAPGSPERAALEVALVELCGLRARGLASRCVSRTPTPRCSA